MFEGILMGLNTALSLQNLMMVIIGCLLGTFIGMLPGLGPMSIIAIMIPVAIKIGDPSAALIMLAGVYYGAIFGGSTSSILINAPGVAGTVATGLRRLSAGARLGQCRQGAGDCRLSPPFPAARSPRSSCCSASRRRWRP